jgi:nucleotide-binding universal stress UspA family protein
VELLAVVDIAEMAAYIPAEHAQRIEKLIAEGVRRQETYLERVAKSFPGEVRCAVGKGRAAEAIIEKGAADGAALIAMATHGRSGITRWLLGSVAEKVLRGGANALLLVRAAEQGNADGAAALKSVIVPLDGSELAERALPVVAELVNKLRLGVVLFRAYSLPYSEYAGGDGYYGIDFRKLTTEVREEAWEYLEKKSDELKKLGVENVSSVAKDGLGADEIIKLARETPQSLIAMCSHGRSGVTRWVLGSVTETVVRHCDRPVLIIRAA